MGALCCKGIPSDWKHGGAHGEGPPTELRNLQNKVTIRGRYPYFQTSTACTSGGYEFAAPANTWKSQEGEARPHAPLAIFRPTFASAPDHSEDIDLRSYTLPLGASRS